jgi:hypothetical protein
MMCEYEVIIPHLEASHAINYAIQLAKEMEPGMDLVINRSGRGDKDMPQVAKLMGIKIEITKEGNYLIFESERSECPGLISTTEMIAFMLPSHRPGIHRIWQ